MNTIRLSFYWCRLRITVTTYFYSWFIIIVFGCYIISHRSSVTTGLYIIIYWSKNFSLGCFSIKAFRSHGLLNVRPILCIYSNTFISKQIIRTLPSYSANQKYPFLLNNSFFQRIVYSIQRIPDNLLNQCKLTCSIHNSFEVFFFQKFINCSTPFQVFMTDFTQFEFYT